MERVDLNALRSRNSPSQRIGVNALHRHLDESDSAATHPAAVEGGPAGVVALRSRRAHLAGVVVAVERAAVETAAV